MSGYIKDYRSELSSDIWFMPPMYHRVWQWLKYQVNHAPGKIPMEDGGFFEIKAGQHLTSLRSIAEGVGYYEGLKWKAPNPKTVSSILGWLEKQGMAAIDRGKGNRQYTLITLLNWDSYQSEKVEGNSKVTADGLASKQSADINKKKEEELKKNKEELKDSRKRVYDTNSVEFQLASRLFKRIKENNRNAKEPNLQKWSDLIRLMIEKDERTAKQIEFLIDWAQQDSFWKTNILSAAKLREKFDQLIMVVKAEKERAKAVKKHDKVLPMERPLSLEEPSLPDDIDKRTQDLLNEISN